MRRKGESWKGGGEEAGGNESRVGERSRGMRRKGESWKGGGEEVCWFPRTWASLHAQTIQLRRYRLIIISHICY